MDRLSAGLSLRLLLRSLTIQGSWNYRTMQGAGLGFALVPFLTKLHAGDRAALTESIGRHSGFYNAHPYLATVALAALARMEVEGAGAERIDRFKKALISPLGSLGDRLVWARWRPLCSLVGVLLVVAGAAWWLAVGLFLLLYNAMHLGLRIWGLRLGWREGRNVGRALMGSPLRRLPDRLTIPLTVVSGALLPPLALAAGEGLGWSPYYALAAAFGLGVVGYWRPTLAGRLAALGFFVGMVAFIALERFAW